MDTRTVTAAALPAGHAVVTFAATHAGHDVRRMIDTAPAKAHEDAYLQCMACRSTSARFLSAAHLPEVGMSAEEVAARVSIRRTKDRDGYHWLMKAQGLLTDAEAAGITFRSDPSVTLGETVIVEDADGSRIGYLKSATYYRRALGPAYVVCTIELH